MDWDSKPEGSAQHGKGPEAWDVKMFEANLDHIVRPCLENREGSVLSGLDPQ